MPELPEVESVCRTLSARAVGRTVTAVRLWRADVVTGDTCDAAMLCGCEIREVARHGKQIGIVGEPRDNFSQVFASPARKTPPKTGDALRRGSPAICVHLGMTGSLCYRSSKMIQPSETSGGHIH